MTSAGEREFDTFTNLVPEARAALWTLINGYTWTQLLRVAARLRLADLLAGRTMTLAELASLAAVDATLLHRLLNGLAAIGVVAIDEQGQYRLTAIGDWLRDDVPNSLASFAILSGEEYYRSWLGFDAYARDDRTPFERVAGAPVFDWLADHPDVADRFYRRMATRSMAFAPAVAAVCDLAGARRIVDVGGGYGMLLATFLQRWPNAHGVLFDLPGAATAGEARLMDAGLAGRFEVVGGDFFRDALPAGGDAYLLSQILHDWDDERSMDILRNIRRAIDPDGRLLIIEVLMPDRVEGPSLAVDLDLVMMVLTGGRERTRNEFQQLLSATGFALAHVHVAVAPGGMSVLEARPHA